MKKLTDSIPFSRLLIYIALLGLMPLFVVGWHYTKEKAKWKTITERIMTIHSLSEKKARRQSLNTAVRTIHAKADSFYLDNQVESLKLLKKEREALENLIHNPSFTGNEATEKRYTFLNGEANRLKFTDGAILSGDGLQETIETQAHPVEVDTHDLKEILARVEGNRPGKPQLLITDFKLHKKAHSNGNQVFELNLKLLKREFTQ